MTKSTFIRRNLVRHSKFSQPRDHSGDNENHKLPNITKYDSELKPPKASKKRRIQYD